MDPIVLGRATIAAGQALSTPVATTGYGVCLLLLPAAWSDVTTPSARTTSRNRCARRSGRCA
ncbi:hypothetical protein J4558_11795 [Leptolyngbya sp. 15MV]|nr:hypothetical protein J4558_11795 [Leptolyngbya sp. 15MV]